MEASVLVPSKVKGRFGRLVLVRRKLEQLASYEIMPEHDVSKV